MRTPALVGLLLAALVALPGCTVDAGSTSEDASVAESELGVPAAANAAATPTLAAQCFAPVKQDCSFYASCLEATHPCGASGYALGYGAKYCGRFRANDALSSSGLVWRDEVMVCLQKRLGRFLTQSQATCDAIIDGAFDDHPICYTQPKASICSLPPTDWISIVWTIDQTDLLSDRGRKQMSDTAWRCINQWTRSFLSPFGGGEPEGGEEVDARTRAIAEALVQDPGSSLRSLRMLAGMSEQSE